MKLTKISAAVAAMAISGTASAFGPATVHDLELYISGASAQDKAISALITTMCSDIPDHYTAGKNWNAWSCTLNSAAVGTTLVNPKVLIQKRSAGGSGMGVAPVMNATAIDSMAISAANCTADAVVANQWNCGAPATGANPRVPDLGVADVNPELFVGANVPDGGAAVSPGDISLLMNTKSAAALVFGIPVTTSLRDALQVLQFGAGAPCASGPDGLANWKTTGVVPARETEACMPSLQRNQVASIMAGQVASWNDFYVNGKRITDPLAYGTAAASISFPTDPNSVVTVCRRVNGSGTQAQMSANFLRSPCSSAGVAPVRYNVATEFNGPLVLEGKGSGDVNKCLDDMENATNLGKNVFPVVGGTQGNNPTADGALFNDPSYHRWAIGLQSLEKNPDLQFGYRFVKIDGAAPTIDNVANGTYLDWAEQSYQWRKALAGDKLAIVNHITSNAANATFLGTTLGPKFDYTFGRSGFLATVGTPAANGVVDHLAPVVPYTHAPGTAPLDNCRVPMVKAGAASPVI